MSEATVNSPAAWHPDPSGRHDHRYWDGERWTEHVADAGVASIDPLPDAAATADTRTDVVGHGDTEVIGTRDTEVTGHGDTEAIGTRDTEVTGDRDTEAIGDRDTEVTGDRDAEGIEQHDAPSTPHDGGRAEATPQPGPPTGDPIEDRGASPDGGWGGATAAAPPGGTGQPPAWAGHSSSGPGWGTAPATGSTGLATTALVLGIVSLPLLIFFGLGALLGIAAIVVGIVAVRKARRGEAGGRGLAIGGIATGAVSVVLGILIVIALFAFGFGFADELERCIEETGSQAVCQERLERELTERFLGE